MKMNMKVECLHFEEGAEAKVGEQDMIHYVVFEREVNDILSNFRIIDKVIMKIIKLNLLLLSDFFFSIPRFLRF